MPAERFENPDESLKKTLNASARVEETKAEEDKVVAKSQEKN